MIPAFGMVILTQNPSTGNGQVLGWSWNLSVEGARTGVHVAPVGGAVELVHYALSSHDCGVQGLG